MGFLQTHEAEGKYGLVTCQGDTKAHLTFDVKESLCGLAVNGFAFAGYRLPHCAKCRIAAGKVGE